jgi:hypothetical protein
VLDKKGKYVFERGMDITKFRHTVQALRLWLFTALPLKSAKPEPNLKTEAETTERVNNRETVDITV